MEDEDLEKWAERIRFILICALVGFLLGLIIPPLW